MAHKIAVIGEEDLCMGFGLAGIIKNFTPKDSFEAEALIDEIVAKDEIGMVIIEEELAKGFSYKMKNRLQQMTKPVVVTVPGKMGTEEDSESLSAMIKKAIGVELKQ